MKQAPMAVTVCGIGASAIGLLCSLAFSKQPSFSALAFSPVSASFTMLVNPLSIPHRASKRLERLNELNAINCAHWGKGYTIELNGNWKNKADCNRAGLVVNALFTFSAFTLCYGIEEFWRKLRLREDRD